jgi:hypothetical protein
MSTCDELYHGDTRSIAERVATYVVDHANRLVRTVTNAREVLVRQRRLRETELALDALPDDIRCDIGWPDLYERQVSECNKLKFRR